MDRVARPNAIKPTPHPEFDPRRPVRKAAVTGLASAGALLLLCRVSFAGPPFLSDDPVPVDPGHWEINNYTVGTFAQRAMAGAFPGIDANYGAADNIQFHVLVQAAYAQWDGTSTHYGIGDTEIGIKYRFVAANDVDWWPQIAFYPLLDFPTGNANQGLGTGAVHAFLPIWFEKDLGKWRTYAGGGYWINPGPGNKNYWFAGWVLQYQLTPSLSVGGEIFHATVFSTVLPGMPVYPLGTRDSTGFNLGGTYDFNRTYHLLFSVGRGLQNVLATDTFSYYLALQVTY